MRRIISVLTVTAIMAAMLAATVTPAFAAPSCQTGQHRAQTNAEDRGDFDQLEKHNDRKFGCDLGVPPGHIV